LRSASGSREISAARTSVSADRWQCLKLVDGQSDSRGLIEVESTSRPSRCCSSPPAREMISPMRIASRNISSSVDVRRSIVGLEQLALRGNQSAPASKSGREEPAAARIARGRSRYKQKGRVEIDCALYVCGLVGANIDTANMRLNRRSRHSSICRRHYKRSTDDERARAIASRESQRRRRERRIR